MKRLLPLALFCLCLVFESATAHASKLIVCNRSKDTIRYAIVYETGLMPPIVAEWVAQGWFVLRAGNCETVVEGSTRQQAFLSVQSLYDSGERRAWVFKLAKPPVGSGSNGVEEFLCVKEGNFRRRTKKFDDQWKCPAGYYKQLFNMQMFAVVRTNYTLNLK